MSKKTFVGPHDLTPIQFKDLSVILGQKIILDKINCKIKSNSITAVLGPNGAGKTTLFYIIMGLIKPNSGQIKLDGYDITKLAMYSRARLGISYLPQEPSIFRGMNVTDNINCVLEITEKNSKLRKIKLEKLIERFNKEENRYFNKITFKNFINDFFDAYAG